MRWINYRPLRRPVKHPLQLGGRLTHRFNLLGPETALASIYGLGLIVLLVLHQRSADADKTRDLVKAAPKEQVQMIYLPQKLQEAKPTPPPPQPRPQQPTPEPPASVAAPKTSNVGRAPQQTQSQQSRDLAAADAGKSDAKANEQPSVPARTAPIISAQPATKDPNPLTRSPLTTSPLAAPARHQESQEEEAQRLFGNNRNGPAGRPERAFGGMALPWQTGDQHCMQAPEGADTMTVIAAKVIDPVQGRPIAGAFLQILGTPYSTYSDGGGNYALRFNIALVANCRTQAVRVTAVGYSLRDLILSTGVAWNNDIPLQRN